MIIANIEPVTVFPDSGTKFTVTAAVVRLDDSAELLFAILSDDGRTLKEGRIMMKGHAYEQWGNSDKYPVEVAADALGLVITGWEEKAT